MPRTLTTISITKICRLGLSSAVTVPKHAARTYTIHSSTTPLIVKAPGAGVVAVDGFVRLKPR